MSNLQLRTNVICTQIDPDRPATLSSKILREILRKELRYTKLIISDDMEMKAITDHFGAEDAPRLAVQAGCDILIYRSEAAARHAYSALLKALDEGTLAPELVLEAANRSRELKNEFLVPYDSVNVPSVSKVIGCAQHAEIISRVTGTPGTPA